MKEQRVSHWAEVVGVVVEVSEEGDAVPLEEAAAVVLDARAALLEAVAAEEEFSGEEAAEDLAVESSVEEAGQAGPAEDSPAGITGREVFLEAVGLASQDVP